MFTDKRHVWLNPPLPIRGTHVQAARSGRFSESAEPPKDCGEFGDECPGVYIPRLERDGWEIGAETETTMTLEKRLPKGHVLRKIFHFGDERRTGRSCYWEEHAILAKSGATAASGTDWEWADYDSHRGRILLARAGTICGLPLQDLSAAPRVLQDFNGQKFVATPAPY